MIEVLPDLTEGSDLSQFSARNSRYDSQIELFGLQAQERLSNASAFLVGAGLLNQHLTPHHHHLVVAGAIGCEMLKSWALMGLSTGDRARITVTDMDTIEKSNLNRQFLFRSSDVGQPKSSCAAKASQAMNPHMHVEPQVCRSMQS